MDICQIGYDICEFGSYRGVGIDITGRVHFDNRDRFAIWIGKATERRPNHVNKRVVADIWLLTVSWTLTWEIIRIIFIASCTDNIYDLENERWLLGDMIDHVGIYGSRVAEVLSAFNVGLVTLCHSVSWLLSSMSTVQIPRHINHLKIHRFQGIISRRNNCKVKVDAVFPTIPILVPCLCQFYVIFM